MTKPTPHYSPFGSLISNRSWSDASRIYRYGFNGKEEDKEGMGGGGTTYDYGFRIYNSSLAKFLSVDPLFYKFASNSTYAYAMNRPIDGIDLEGKEWCTQHKWGDVITDVEHIKLLGDDYTEGMTYKDAYHILAPKLAAKRQADGTKFDCADFTIDIMVEFAYMFKLSVHIQDNKPYRRSNDPTFDNDNGGYYDREGKWIAIKDGDWQTFSKAIQKDYTSYDIWVDNNLFTKNITKDYKTEMKTGDIISIQWSKGPGSHYHAQLIVEIKWKEGTYSIIQGNTDDEQKPVKPEKRKNKIWGILKRIITGSDGKDKEPANSLKVKQWNFEYFDKNG